MQRKRNRRKTHRVRDTLAALWIVGCIFVAGIGLASFRMIGL